MPSELFPLILLKLLRDVPVIIELTFILAIVFTLNKAYRNSELINLENAGYGELQIFTLLNPIIVFFVLFSFTSNLYLTPYVKSEINIYAEKAKARPDFVFFREGVFQNFTDGDLTLFVSKLSSEDKSHDQKLENIFLYKKKDSELVLAKNGFKKIDNSYGDVLLTLLGGRSYKGLNTENFSVTDFDKAEILLFDSDKKSKNIELTSETKDLNQLIGSKLKEDKIELMYRITAPISLYFLSMFAVLLSKTNPRNKRNLSLGIVILIYLAYHNLIVYIKSTDAYSISFYLIQYLLIFFVLLASIYILVLFKKKLLIT